MKEELLWISRQNANLLDIIKGFQNFQRQTECDMVEMKDHVNRVELNTLKVFGSINSSDKQQSNFS
jgi:hypothetical protein